MFEGLSFELEFWARHVGLKGYVVLFNYLLESLEF